MLPDKSLWLAEEVIAKDLLKASPVLGRDSFQLGIANHRGKWEQTPYSRLGLPGFNIGLP